MLTKRHTVGIRIPAHPVCEAIAEALGNPLISTSAVIGDGPVWSDPKEINEVLGKRLAMVVDSGIIPAVPSSVISLVNDEPLVLRKGKGDCSIFTDAEF
jgi:tRNA threonylcarbamoyl adenosine modification protein (Sua5/YciO/YrdC/YwlC family)